MDPSAYRFWEGFFASNEQQKLQAIKDTIASNMTVYCDLPENMRLGAMATMLLGYTQDIHDYFEYQKKVDELAESVN